MDAYRPASTLGWITYIFTAYTVPILWLISNISLIFHYKGCHTWKETNGPKFEIKKSNQDDTLQIQNTTDELRNHSNFKSQTCNVMNNFEISCFTYTCCSENTLKIIFNRNCFKTERNELENRIYKSQFEMSSVEPLIQSCNSMVLEWFIWELFFSSLYFEPKNIKNFLSKN